MSMLQRCTARGGAQQTQELSVYAQGLLVVDQHLSSDLLTRYEKTKGI